MTDLLGMLGGDGWDKFDGIEQKLAAERRELADAALAEAGELARVFDTPAWKRVLEILERQSVRQPHMLPLGGKYSLEQQALYAAYRQGQKDLLAVIVNAVAVARGNDPSIGKGEQ